MANDLQTTTRDWRYYQGHQGQQRPLKDVTPPNAAQRALPPPSTTTPSPNMTTQSRPSLAQKAWNGTKKIGKGASKLWVGMAGINGLIDNAMTPSEDYYERFGMTPYDDSRGALGHFGVRALGYASDLGNALTGGTIGDLVFADKIRQKKEAEQAQNTPTPTQSTQQDKLKALSDQMTTPKAPQNIQPNTEQPAIPTATTSQTYTPQMGMGVPVNNPNYAELVNQINQMQQRTMADTQAYFGKPAHTPRRDQENQQQREELLRQATTVHKGAHGLTANQLRLAHELTNDDIKLAQERYMQQNNLNHQLQQEQLQQQAQNARTLAGEQGAMARTAMNEQGVNQRFNIGHGLDVYKTMQNGQQTQAELGLRLAELQQRSNNDQQDRMAQNEQMNLYQQFANAKDDVERDKILTQMAVLQGKPLTSGTLKDNFITVKNVDGGEDLIDLRTLQTGGQKQIDFDALEKEMAKDATAEDKKAILSKYGVSPAEYQAVLAIIEQRQAQKEQGA